MGSEMWPGCIVSVTSTTTSTLPRPRGESQRFAVAAAERLRVLRADPQRAERTLAMPAGIADRRVAGVAAALACGKHERERRVVRLRAQLELLQFRQQLGQVQVDAVIRQAHGLPAIGVLADREHHAGRAVEDRVEQAIAGEDASPPKPARAAASGWVRTYSCAMPHSDAAGASPGAAIGPSVR